MVERIIGKKVVGIKQSIKAIRSGESKTVYIANDAEMKLVQQIVKLANENSLEVIHVNSMTELGKLCGIDVGAASAVVLKE